MNITDLNTGYTVANRIFDTTIVENPYYETSSVRDSFIEQIKNSIIIIDETINESQAEVVEFPKE